MSSLVAAGSPSSMRGGGGASSTPQRDDVSLHTARDLLILQGEIDKNAAIIAGLKHETAEAIAAISSSELAAKRHHDALLTELETMRTAIKDLQLQVQGGPTVNISQLEAATAKLSAKKAEWKKLQTECNVMEGVLKQFVLVEALRIQELFDTAREADVVALQMLLSSSSFATSKK